MPPTSVARNGTPIVKHSPTTHGLFSTSEGIITSARRDRLSRRKASGCLKSLEEALPPCVIRQLSQRVRSRMLAGDPVETADEGDVRSRSLGQSRDSVDEQPEPFPSLLPAEEDDLVDFAGLDRARAKQPVRDSVGLKPGRQHPGSLDGLVGQRHTFGAAPVEHVSAGADDRVRVFNQASFEAPQARGRAAPAGSGCAGGPIGCIHADA